MIGQMSLQSLFSTASAGHDPVWLRYTLTTRFCPRIKPFESWMEAAGKNQIPALMVKHVILVSLVIAGLVVLFRVRRIARGNDHKEFRG